MTVLIKAILATESAILLLMALLAFEQTLRKGDNSRLYLVAFLIISALYIISIELGYYAPQPLSIWAEGIKIPLILSNIPLAFLFLSAIVTGKLRPSKQVLYHLLPGVVFLLTLPLILFFSYFDKSGVFEPGLLNLWISFGYTILILQTVAYSVMFFLKFSVYSRRLQEYYLHLPGVMTRFRNLLIAFLVYFLLIDIWLTSIIVPEREFAFVYPLLLFLSAAYTGIAGKKIDIKKDTQEPVVSLIRNQDLLQETVIEPPVREIPVEPSSVEIIEIVQKNKEEETEKPGIVRRKIAVNGRKPFDESQKKALYKRMLNMLITNELYTDPKLTLKQLANELGTNTRYLSMVINEFQGRNFNQMLNYYRVKKVMRLLVDNEAESYSYLGLAQKAGFHSKSVFIAAFKSQTGTTPSEFSGTMKKLIKA